MVYMYEPFHHGREKIIYEMAQTRCLLSVKQDKF